MSRTYFGFSVSNTNGNSNQRSVVRVYNDKNEKIAEQFINKHNPLNYIRGLSRSKHLDSLKTQCLKGGMTESQFNGIFNR